MKKTIFYLVVVAIFFSVSLLSLSSVSIAVPDQPSSEIPAGRGDSQDYKPVERPADDTSMAIIAVAVFVLPVAGWFIVRSVRRGKKKS